MKIILKLGKTGCMDIHMLVEKSTLQNSIYDMIPIIGTKRNAYISIRVISIATEMWPLALLVIFPKKKKFTQYAYLMFEIVKK